MIAIIFILGACIGSFLSLCIYRIPKNESIISPSSYCEVCMDKIPKYNLIPIISYVFLRGKSSCCREKIKMQSTIIEIVSGVAFVIFYINFGLTFEFFIYSFLIGVLIVTSIIDINTGYIYSKVSIAGILGGLLYILYNHIINKNGAYFLFGGIIACLIIITIILLTRGMGWGDVEVALMIGLYLGIKNSILMIILSIIFGGIVGIYLIIFKNKKRGCEMAFAPYLSIGGVVAILFGEEIRRAYMIYYGF